MNTLNREPVNWRLLIGGMLILLVVAGIAGRSDYEDALLEERAYCEQVDLWYNTAGEQGWPDYNENYLELCEKS